MTTTEPTVLVHLWQSQQLGTAPFRCVACISMPGKGLLEAGCIEAYNNQMAEACQQARHYGVGIGTCDSCGMGLQSNFVIRDAKGKYFVVGCDCANKTHDTKFMTEVKFLEKQRQDKIKEAKRVVARAERERLLEIELAAQRGRNGGLTDRQVQEQKELDERLAKQAAMKAINIWLIQVLNQVPYHSDFVVTMRDRLDYVLAKDLPPKCVNILADVYAKTASEGARRGSTKYDTRYDEFFAKLEA